VPSERFKIGVILNEGASRLEYQRLSQLNKEDKNASDKTVQAGKESVDRGL
jgi:hypothetical protein